MTSKAEEFEEFVDDALRPDDYPGDDAMIENPDAFDADGRISDPEASPAFVPARERWRITDRDGAAWALRRYRRARAEIDEVVALAERLVAEANAYMNEACQGAERDARFFESKLREYHEGAIVGQKTKVVKLPGGRLKGTLGSVRTVVDDLVAFTRWVRGERLSGEVLRPVKPREPMLDEVKRRFSGKLGDEPGEYPAVTAEGEVVPGVHFERGLPSFGVVLDEED